jgi:hypothetical protein
LKLNLSADHRRNRDYSESDDKEEEHQWH